MAILTNSYETFDAAGIGEDLSDMISMISRRETPFMSSVCKKGPAAKQTFVQWQIDTLATAAQNAQIQGEDYKSAGLDAAVATTVTGNYCQISEKDVTITGTNEVVTAAGRASEMAYQKAKMIKELKRDIEFSMLGNYGAVVPSTGTAGISAGVEAWIKTNTVFESAGTDPVYVGNLPTDPRNDGTPDAFAEADIKEAMQEAYTAGGNPSVLFLGVFNKAAFSAFTGIAANRHMATGQSQTQIIGAADVYVSDYGVLTVVTDIFQRTVSAFAFDTDHWQIRWLRPLTSTPLAKTGDADTEMMLGEWTLVSLNEAASAGIYDITGS
jgi:hypothetical protein